MLKRSGHLNFADDFGEIGPMAPKSWKTYQSKLHPTCPQDKAINLPLTPNYWSKFASEIYPSDPLKIPSLLASIYFLSHLIVSILLDWC